LTCTSGDAFATDSSTFERLQRIVNSCGRAWRRALNELQRLQAKLKPKWRAAMPCEPRNPNPSPLLKMGSVRNKPKTPPPTASQPDPAPPFAAPNAPASPEETRPSIADPEQKPPEAA
jgi:hypothetical protein